MTIAPDVISLSHKCATQIYGNTAPSPLYAMNVALLLAGTAATESHLKFRRQVGYSMGDQRGAFGLWQTEELPLNDNVMYLRNRPDVKARSGRFLYGENGGDIDAILAMGTHGMARLCAGWDRFACLMARIHYMRFPAAVPGNDHDRAAYYKKYYNTVAGKGSVEKYLHDYRALIAPHLQAGL